MRLSAYKVELEPTPRQAEQFRRHAGTARYVYNWSVADRIERHENGEKTGLYEQKRRFNATKDAVCPWVRETLYRVTEQAMMNADAAFQNFFRRLKERRAGKSVEDVGFPRFKSKRHSLGSFVLRDCVVTPTRIWMDRRYFGWVRLKEHGYLPCSDDLGRRMLRATFVEKAGRWYVSVQVQEDVGDPLPATGPAVTVTPTLDGVAAVWEDGREHVYQHRMPMAANAEQVKRLQRKISRQDRTARKRKPAEGEERKSSKNREKTRRRLARLHARIERIREHGLHQVSHALTVRTKPSTLRLEKPDVQALLQNHKTAERAADAALFELERQIRYKASWNGVVIPEEETGEEEATK